jgi:hypothetical protein
MIKMSVKLVILRYSDGILFSRFTSLDIPQSLGNPAKSFYF